MFCREDFPQNLHRSATDYRWRDGLNRIAKKWRPGWGLMFLEALCAEWLLWCFLGNPGHPWRRGPIWGWGHNWKLREASLPPMSRRKLTLCHKICWAPFNFSENWSSGYDIHSSPWKILENHPSINGGFVRWESHLFQLGPSKSHGELLVITWGYIPSELT